MNKSAQKVSMTDIARHLNISQATVSYVLSGRASGPVNEETRKRVIEAAQELGYRRNRAAQALAGRRSQVIELCVSGFYPSYYAQVLESFRTKFRSTGYELHITSTHSSREEEWGKLHGDWPVDGIIADIPLSKEILSSLLQRKIPVVCVGLYSFIVTDTDHIYVDFRPAIEEGLRHLVQGCRRMAFVSMWSAEAAATEYGEDPRYPIYRKIVREARLEEEVIVAADSDRCSIREITYQAVCNHVKNKGCPDAFFCFNDERAIATLTALHDLGTRVPEDVRLFGCDGIEDTEYHRPGISTIQYPFEEVAHLACELLLNRIQHPDTPLKNLTLFPKVLLRASSRIS